MSSAALSNDPAGNQTPDLDKYPNAKKLVERCWEFFQEVQDLYVIWLVLHIQS